MASWFSTTTSGQMPGWPAATLVMSRKPPAARRRRIDVGGGGVGGQVHESSRSQVRGMRDEGDQFVVATGVEGDGVGPELADESLNL